MKMTSGCPHHIKSRMVAAVLGRFVSTEIIFRYWLTPPTATDKWMNFSLFRRWIRSTSLCLYKWGVCANNEFLIRFHLLIPKPLSTQRVCCNQREECRKTQTFSFHYRNLRKQIMLRYINCTGEQQEKEAIDISIYLNSHRTPMKVYKGRSLNYFRWGQEASVLSDHHEK